MTSPSSASFITSNRRKVLHSLLGIFVGINALPSLAQPRNFEVEATYHIFDAPLSSHRFNRLRLTSEKGYEYEVFIAIPNEAPGDAGYAIIYMLDGNAVFDRLSPEILAQNQGTVIVGVGYPTPYIHDVIARSRDYTPAVPQGIELPRNVTSRPTGEAADFLDFIQGELRAHVEKTLNINSDHRALWGHSYGGLFCLYALLSAPDSFASYLAISPSVSWGEYMLQAMASDAPRRQNAQPAHVWIMLGDQERRRHATQQPQTQESLPNPATLDLVEALRLRSDLEVQVKIFEGLGHGATFTASFPYLADAI